jgi:hypothetical protein
VPYEELLKQLFKPNAGYFQLQMASERDRDLPTSWSANTCARMPKASRKWRISAASGLSSALLLPKIKRSHLFRMNSFHSHTVS